MLLVNASIGLDEFDMDGAVLIAVVISPVELVIFSPPVHPVQPLSPPTQKEAHIFPVHLVKEVHQPIFPAQLPTQVRLAHNLLLSSTTSTTASTIIKPFFFSFVHILKYQCAVF